MLLPLPPGLRTHSPVTRWRGSTTSSRRRQAGCPESVGAVAPSTCRFTFTFTSHVAYQLAGPADGARCLVRTPPCPTQTPRAPIKPLAALLSPALWLLNSPDRFDMWSLGIVMLQVWSQGIWRQVACACGHWQPSLAAQLA